MASDRVDAETAGAGVDADVDTDVVDLADVLRGEDVGGCSQRVDVARTHQDQRVRHAGRVVEVVQHDADGDAVLLDEIAHQVEGLDLVAQVQVVGRFVQQHDAGVLGQAGREPDPLHLTAGEFPDRPVGHVAYTGDTHGVVDGAPVLGRRPGEAAPVGVASEGHDLPDRQPLGRGPRLGEERDLAGELAGAEQ